MRLLHILALLLIIIVLSTPLLFYFINLNSDNKLKNNNNLRINNNSKEYVSSLESSTKLNPGENNLENNNGATITDYNNISGNENLVFIIPNGFMSHTDYSNTLTNLVNDVNKIYTKNTIKHFNLVNIIYYNQTKCNGPDFNPCANIMDNVSYYSNKTLSVFIVKRNAPNTISNSIQMHVILKLPSTEGETIYPGLALTLSHELGHVYGAGIPELYNLLDIKDQTSVPPIYLKTNYLPNMYRWDPMISQVQNSNEAEFGPLSVYLINNKPSIDYIWRYFPLETQILVQEAGEPVNEAQVNVFCLSRSGQLSIKEPSVVVKTDRNGQATLQRVIYDEYGNPQFVNQDVLSSNCDVNLLKVYSNGGYNVRSISALELEEEKILRKNDKMIISINLSAKDTTKKFLDKQVFLGNKDAPVHILEFCDLTSKYCADFNKNILSKLIEDYINKNKAYFEFKNFPLESNSLSNDAAKAIECVKIVKEDIFYDYVDLLLNQQDQWKNSGSEAKELFSSYASSLGVNVNDFNDCFINDQVNSLIDAQKQEGINLGIAGVPATLINDKEIDGVPSYNEFVSSIDKAQ